MKLNLSRNQILFAILYSSLFPIFSYLDLQITVHKIDLLGISEYSRFLMSFCAVISLPFLIIGYVGLAFVLPSFLMNQGFFQLFSFICIFFQVILVMHFINQREKKQNEYFLKRQKENQ
jgi:hypothetical protein